MYILLSIIIGVLFIVAGFGGKPGTIIASLVDTYEVVGVDIS